MLEAALFRLVDLEEGRSGSVGDAAGGAEGVPAGELTAAWQLGRRPLELNCSRLPATSKRLVALRSTAEEPCRISQDVGSTRWHSQPKLAVRLRSARGLAFSRAIDSSHALSDCRSVEVG